MVFHCFLEEHHKKSCRRGKKIKDLFRYSDTGYRPKDRKQCFLQVNLYLKFTKLVLS